MSAKPTRYHDIVLAPLLKKRHLKPSEVITVAHAKTDSIENLNRSWISSKTDSNLSKSQSIQTPNKFALRDYYFEDSEEIVFNSVDIFYAKKNISKEVGIGADVGYFYLKRADMKKYDGFRYGISLLWNNFVFRLGANQYDNFSEFVPSVSYENNYKKHNYILEYTYQNSLFYTFSLSSYEKRINVHHISVSDYLPMQNNTDLWANITANFYTNSDTEFIAQFDWRFYYNTIAKNFSYNLALEGWYDTHSKPNEYFYSPHFTDSTLLRIDPQYVFNKYIGTRGKFGLGYSFKDKTMAYKAGLWLFGNPKENLSYNTGCLYSNASRISQDSSYSSKECKINLEYAW